MDPFEVRMRFTSLLTHLNASHTSHTKAAVFALKNRDLDEDLHSCILEQLERNSMNNRANIMYFIDVLCELSMKEAQKEGITGEPGTSYERMMQRDILRVVDSVVPEDGAGAANVRVARKVLQSLEGKGVLLPETVVELDGLLKSRDIAPSHPFIVDANGGATVPLPGARNGGSARLDKRQIEQRIEEDRERHKRARESIWAVPGAEEKEMDRLWEEASDVGEDDYLGGEEDKLERQQVIAMG